MDDVVGGRPGALPRPGLDRPVLLKAQGELALGALAAAGRAHLGADRRAQSTSPPEGRRRSSWRLMSTHGCSARGWLAAWVSTAKREWFAGGFNSKSGRDQAGGRSAGAAEQAGERQTPWDQGAEMAAHRGFTIATDVPDYFRNPASPWQRRSNENTNGLLRQHFPSGLLAA